MTIDEYCAAFAHEVRKLADAKNAEYYRNLALNPPMKSTKSTESDKESTD